MQNQNNKFKFPSLRSASSQLDKILAAKEEILQKSYENSDLSYNENSLNNLNSKIRTLKKYEINLNLKNSKQHDNKINSIHSNQLLASLQNQNLSNALGLPNGEVSTSESESNKNYFSMFSLKNDSNKNKINNDKSLVSLQEMSLPLVFYPNVNRDLGNKGILDLKLNTVKRYINVFSKFNSEIATFQNIDFKFSSGHNHSIKNINTILESLFRRFFALISKPNFDISATKVGLRIFYLLVEPKPKKENKTKNNASKTKNNIKNKKQGNFVKDLFRRGESFKLKQLELLGNLLIKIYNKPVEFEITKLVKPYNDSTILSKSLGMLSNSVKYTSILYKFLKNAKFKNPTKMFRKTEEKSLQSISPKGGNSVPAFLSGVKVRVGGRLLTQSVIPRRTVSIYQRGCLARGKADFVNTARFTNKNKRGSYSITVSVASFSAV